MSKIEALYFVWFNTQSGPTKGHCGFLSVPLTLQSNWDNSECELSQPQQQHNLNTAVGLDMKMTLHTTTTTQTQHQPLGAPDEHLLTPTLYGMISNNKQGHNNDINNNNNNNNNINNNNNNKTSTAKSPALGASD